MRRSIVLTIVLTALAGTGAAQGLSARVQVSSLTLPQNLESTVSNWCTWSWCSIGPRLYHEPRADGSLLVGWTDSAGDGHVSVVAQGSISTTHNLAGTRVKGLVAHDDGGFAILCWDSGDDVMWLSRHSASGSEVWSTNLNSTIAIFDNDIGDSRLAFDGTSYAAYYTVYGISGMYTGHNGDQLRYVSSAGVIEPGGWSWGCSHSMAQLVGYHPQLDRLTSLCSSDCYPGKGLFADHNYQLEVADGDCHGMVSLQLGQMAAAASTWKVVFNALDRACCSSQGIGLATFDAGYQTTIAWLTDSDGSSERDPVLARLPDGTSGERYLVGWRIEGTGADFLLGIIDGSGAFVEGPESVGAAGIAWNQRDDSFRSNPDGSVTWLQANPSQATLRLFRFASDGIFADGFESGNTIAWSATGS